MYAAKIEIGWLEKWFEGESASKIIEEVEHFQDFGCLMSMGRREEKKAGQKQLDKLEVFLNKYYAGELSIEDLKALDVKLSIGNIKCHEIVEGKENVDAVMGR